MARKSRRQVAALAENKPKTVSYATWGYTRISIDGERSEDSTESQSAIIRNYVSDKPDICLNNVISDLGFTGRDFDRPGYMELLDGIKQGDVGCVIVKDLSRLGRTYIEVGELLFDTFPAHNVRFVSVNDNYDSFADDAARKKLLILFKNLVNHMYSMDLGKKIRSAHTAKKQRGELAGIPPYGYKRGEDGITLVPDGDAAETVKRVFALRMAGNSANSIAKLLTREGVPSPQNRRYQLGQIAHEKFAERIVWSIGTVSKMLKYETYTGTLVQGKYDCDGKRHAMLPKEQWIRHENTHPAIISREQFDAVQKLMQATAAKYERGKGTPLSENRYAGKIYCSRCGHAALRMTGGSTYVLFYYLCRQCNNDLKAELNLERTSKLPLVKLDSVVMETLKKQMDVLVDSDRLIEKLVKSEPYMQRQSMLLREKSTWEESIVSTDKTLSNAYIHHLDGLLDFREFELVRAKVEQDKKDAIMRLEQIESELQKSDKMTERHSHWRKIYSAFRNSKTPTKELIQTLIDRIELTPLTNEIHVVMNYSDGLKEYMSLLGESEVSGNE